MSFDEEDFNTEEGRAIISNQIWRRIDAIVAESMVEFNDDLADLYERKQAIALGSLDNTDFDSTKRGRFFNPEAATDTSPVVAKGSQDIFNKEKQTPTSRRRSVLQMPSENIGHNDNDDFQTLKIKNSEDSLDEEDLEVSILDRGDSQPDLDARINRNRHFMDRGSVVRTKVSLTRSILIQNLDRNPSIPNDQLLDDHDASFASDMNHSRCDAIDPVASAFGALDLFSTF